MFIKPFVYLLFGSLFIQGGSANVPKADAKTASILNALIRDVLFNVENDGARKFYGTPRDMTVILLDGSDLKHTPVQWPAGFKPDVAGFTFVFGHQGGLLGNPHRDRRLAIRLDQFVLDPAAEPKVEHPLYRFPIHISIQNGGGTRNGAVMGGQTTFYSIVHRNGAWQVEFAAAVD